VQVLDLIPPSITTKSLGLIDLAKVAKVAVEVRVVKHAHGLLLP
jgi:hypothetical protein